MRPCQPQAARGAKHNPPRSVLGFELRLAQLLANKKTKNEGSKREGGKAERKEGERGGEAHRGGSGQAREDGSDESSLRGVRNPN